MAHELYANTLDAAQELAEAWPGGRASVDAAGEGLAFMRQAPYDMWEDIVVNDAAWAQLYALGRARAGEVQLLANKIDAFWVRLAMVRAVILADRAVAKEAA